MLLQELVSPWYQKDLPNIKVDSLCTDSRKLKRGDVFLAYPGASTDARVFISDALASDIAAILFEPHNYTLPPIKTSIPCIPVANLAMQVGHIAARFYGHPAEALSIIGITGTNGKTTIAYQLCQAYALLGIETRYIGTIGQGHWDALANINNTTPGALELQALLANYVTEGVRIVCMEVSSHALAQGRTAGIRFAQAIFSNLSLDHLDYHETMEAYAGAKAKLFEDADLGLAILNADDSYSRKMRQAVCKSIPIFEYGRAKQADFCVLESSLALQTSELTFTTPSGEVRCSIQSPGAFNVYNSLAIAASLFLNGHSNQVIASLLPQLKAAPGRMERLLDNPIVFMDYAHTPDALENVLKTIRPLTRGRLLTVFGCGGDRDKSKRPLMAAVAARYSDISIVTSDNPRTEAPESIIEDIILGFPPETVFKAVVDRREAMRQALSLANAEDIILLAGKGHETYQIIGEQKFDFDEKRIIMELVQEKH